MSHRRKSSSSGNSKIMAPNKIQCTGPRVVTAICTRDQGLATSNGSTSSRSQTVHKTAFSDQIKEQQVQDWVDTSSEYSRTPQFQALASMNAACQVTIPGDFLSGYPADELYFLGPCSDDDKSTGDNLPLEWNRNDFHTFGMPGSSDMIYTTSGDSHQVFSDCFKDEPHQGLLGCYPTPQTNWSSPSSAPMEPSLPSSYSRPSLLSKNFGSPISQSSHEDFSSNASNEESMLSPLSLGGPAQGAYHAPLFDPQYDTASTLRPSNGFPRPSLANMPYPVSCDPHSVSMVGPSMDMQMYRRMSGESDNTTARNNALYHVGPREDGLYHCPFEAEGECGHKPEKLKCNYDKHLDSHLKPYRCKVPACSSVPFSSTACLLRHEREAHGMHGHGDKPYLCKYKDCDRSVHGNGFPRRWNLQDHMKRMHDYTGSPSNGRSSPAISDGSNPRSRKRKPSTPALSTANRRPKTGPVSKAVPKPALPEKQKESIQRHWSEQYPFEVDDMSALSGHCLQPTDFITNMDQLEWPAMEYVA